MIHNAHSMLLFYGISISICISVIISVAISGHSSSLPAHIWRVTLSFCTGDFTCRFLCLDAVRRVTIVHGDFESCDSERLCDVTGSRYTII